MTLALTSRIPQETGEHFDSRRMECRDLIAKEMEEPQTRTAGVLQLPSPWAGGTEGSGRAGAAEGTSAARGGYRWPR